MVTRLQVRNYRSLGDVDVELGPLTVLVGPNGAGKSNFIDVLRFVSDCVRTGLDTAVTRRHGMAGVRRWSTGRPRDVSIRLTFGPDRDPRWRGVQHGDYALEIGSAKSGRYRIKRETLAVAVQGGDCSFDVVNGRLERIQPDLLTNGLSPDAGLLLPIWPHPTARRLAWYLRSLGLYSVFPNELRRPREPDPDRALDPHGGNLASVLQRLEQENGHALHDIEAALGAAVPGVTGLHVEPVGGYLVIKIGHEEDTGAAHRLDAAHESDGTLRMLGILTALYQRPSPSLIAIEEPELTVHPGVLGVLRDVIEEASQRRTQVILTTHSPDLMTQFGVDCLRVVEMTPQGTAIGPVAQYQQEAVRRQLFSPGDIARVDGLRREGGDD
jgi:predicted ATPase